jgi:hypothetical protein
VRKSRNNGLLCFSPITQDAIKHNSFLCPEKKLEQGNIEEAFEKVDQIVEGKSLGRVNSDFVLNQTSTACDIPSERSSSEALGLCHMYTSLRLCICELYLGVRGKKLLRFCLVKGRGKNRTWHF